MKTKCTLIGGILSLISNAINVVFNSIVVFVIWLAIEIANSLSGESSVPLQSNITLLLMISIIIFSIINICFNSILLVKRKKRILPIRIILLVSIFLTIIMNILLVLNNLQSAIIIVFGLFVLFAIAEFTLILIDTIRFKKTETVEQFNEPHNETLIEENNTSEAK